MARKAGLCADDVLDAAVAVADRDGFDGLTLSAVAAALGVRSPSLYAHVDGLPGLRRALTIRGAGRLAVTLTTAAGGRDGEDALRAFARAYRGFALRNPGLYAATQVGSPPDQGDPVAVALAEPIALVAAALVELGHPPEGTITAIRALRASLHGWVRIEAAGGFDLPEDVEVSFEAMLDVVIAGLRTLARPGT